MDKEPQGEDTALVRMEEEGMARTEADVSAGAEINCKWVTGCASAAIASALALPST